MSSQTHETLAPRHDVKMGSDRGFGIVFAVVFGLIGIWPALKLGWRPRFDLAAVREWWLAASGIFLAVALLHPTLLHPLNRLWFAFGLLLGKIMSPVVMGLLFAIAVVPTGLIMRLRGHDLLRLKLDRASKSYWILREPPGPARDSMGNQF